MWFNPPSSWFRDPSCWCFVLKLLLSRLARPKEIGFLSESIDYIYIYGFESVWPLNFCDIPTRRRLPSLKEQGCHPNSMWTRCDSHPCFSGARAPLGRSDSVGSMTTAYHLVLCTHCVPFSSPTIKILPELHEWLIGKQHISRAFSSWPPQWHTQKHIRSKRPHFQGDSTCYTSKFCEWCPETCCLLVGKFGHGFSLLPAGVISFINSSFCPTFCWFPMVSHFSWPFGLVWSYGNVHNHIFSVFSHIFIHN